MADAVVSIRIEVDDETRGGLRRVSNSTRGLRQELNRLDRAALQQGLGRFNSQLRTVDRSSRTAARGVRTLRLELASVGPGFRTAAGAARGLLGPLAALGAAGAGAGLVSFASQAQQLQNRLRLVSDSAEELAQNQRAIAQIADTTRQPIAAVADLFTSASIAAKELGASQEELFQLTEVTGQALAVQGGTAAEASGALRQLSQSFSSGIVRAEEFNSILEGAFPLAQAAARGLDAAGGSVGRLRQLVVEGAVSSRDFFNAILDGSEELEAQFNRTNVTVGQALTRIQNALVGAFSGDEVQPLIDSLTDLGETLQSPEVVRSLNDLARLFVDFAAAGVDAATFVADSLNVVFGVVQGLGIEIGILIDRIRAIGSINLGNLFSADAGVFDEFTREQEEISRVRREALTQLAADRLGIEQETNQAITNDTRNAATEQTAAVEAAGQAQVAVAQRSASEIKKLISEAERGIKDSKKLIEELQGEIDALDEVPRSDDAFIAQTQRLADLRRAQTALSAGQNQEAREIARNLIEEAAELDDVIQKNLLLTQGKRILREANTSLIEAEQANIDSLKAQKAELDGTAEAARRSAEGLEQSGVPETTVRTTQEYLAAIEELRQELGAETPDRVLAGILAFRDAQAQAAGDAGALQDQIVGTAQAFDQLNASTENVGENLTTGIAQAATALGILDQQQTTVEVDDNLDEVTQRAIELQRELQRLNAGGQVTAVANFNTGGRVPGAGNRDTVPAMLTPGEYVINKRATARNLDLLRAINGGVDPITAPVQKFQDGGLVMPASTAGVAPGTLTPEDRSSGVVDVNFQVNSDTIGRLKGSRAEARRLASALRDLSRGIAGG